MSMVHEYLSFLQEDDKEKEDKKEKWKERLKLLGKAALVGGGIAYGVKSHIDKKNLQKRVADLEKDKEIPDFSQDKYRKQPRSA